MKDFKPLLAPNKQVDLDTLTFPKLASFKLDGVRGLFLNGNFVSRSFKDIQNVQLREKFKGLMEYTSENNFVIDGEIYDEDLTFQEIITHVMTKDFTDKKTVKKHGKVLETPENLKFHIFDVVDPNNLDEPFEDRLVNAEKINELFSDITVLVDHVTVNSKQDIEDLFQTALNTGNEGLMLRNPQGRYKTGRASINMDIIYKVKPYRTYDARIISVSQGTVVKEDAEKKLDKFGRSVTSIKKDDRELSDMAQNFVVMYEGKELKVSVSSLTHDERKAAWDNRDNYVGMMIEYKAMDVGAKDLPRHPVFERFRLDR